jgi:ABC-type multidrug transport system fused ATPase/permease subunit
VSRQIETPRLRANAKNIQSVSKLIMKIDKVLNYFQIIALKDGKVEEKGTHDQLIKIKNGYYADLVKSQM